MKVANILNEFLAVSIALSREKNTSKLLEHILLAAKSLSHADGGTIYSVNSDKQLVFDTLYNDSLNMHLGGSSRTPIEFSPIPIFIDGEINSSSAVSHAAATGRLSNVDDLYKDQRYQSSRAKEIDRKHNYRTQSVLTIPMKDHEGELNGVLQLINAKDADGNTVPFNDETVRSVEALTSLASVALTNRQLIDTMEELFQAFTRLIAKAIDEKSPYTGGHCRRVPELTMMIAEAVHRHDDGPLAEFQMSDADKKELALAGWMHDCGKVATPEYIMDKSKKLETVFDRIELIKTRFELAKRDAEVEALQALMKNDCPDRRQRIETKLAVTLARLDKEYQFVEQTNTGGEFMDEADQQHLADISRLAHVKIQDQETALLTEEEIYNLKTARGTLNPDERKIVNRHMDITVEMLEALPFPKHLQRVPEFAGGHHEKMDGTGYPKGLTREQMSLPARMMAIADIFEALTAADRPYKDAKKVSECLRIMGFMCQDDHIDPDLFEVFIKQGVYKDYAQRFCKPEQMDEVSLDNIPGLKKGH